MAAFLKEMLYSLALMFLNNVCLRYSPWPWVLSTIGIGSLTYGEVILDTNFYLSHDSAKFLHLRIYHVNYDCYYHNTLKPKLSLVAKVTTAEAQGNAEYLDIFDIYWLDAAPRRPKRIHG